MPGAGRRPAGRPFAHVVVDEAQELTDAEWQMLLLRCPCAASPSSATAPRPGTGSRTRGRSGSSRAGLDRVDLASLRINYRTPEEVMAEAEPVIRAAFPTPTCRPPSAAAASRSSTAPVRARRDPGHLAGREPRRDRVRHRLTRVRGDGPVRSLTPELAKGSSSTSSSSSTPSRSATGIEGAVDRYVAMTRATQQLVILGFTGGRVALR